MVEQLVVEQECCLDVKIEVLSLAKTMEVKFSVCPANCGANSPILTPTILEKRSFTTLV
jgi:hypothetical protein